MSESIDGLNVQGMFVFEMLPIFFRHFHRARGHQNEERYFEKICKDTQ